jgi:hypothetical protein
MPNTISDVGDANDFFELTSQLYQTPVYVSSKAGCRVQGRFSLRAKSGPQGSGVSVVILKSKIIFVVDVSGSMAGDRIDALRKAILALLDVTPDGQALGVLTFSSATEVEWLIFPTVLDEEQRKVVTEAVKGLKTKNQTCFSVPLQMAVENLLGSSEQVLQIEFMSDGDSNNGGITYKGSYLGDIPGTLALAANDIAGKINFNVYGMGDSYNETFMNKLVGEGDGTLYHIFGSGTNLDQVVGLNAARAARAVATNVVVEVETYNGFVFYADPKTNKYELYRTAPNKTRISPMSPTSLIDPVKTVNEVEGIPYEFILAGPAIQPPQGQGDKWELLVATMTIRYDVGAGERVQRINLVQTFTTDAGKVAQDKSVASTMLNTAGEVRADELIQAYTQAVTMGKTAEALEISRQMTMAAEEAGRAGLSDLSITLGGLADGMGSGDKSELDALKAKQTMMRQSMGLEDFMAGMGSDD